jgi:stress response protein YsnF
MSTLTALYDTRGAADTARAGLIDIGIEDEQVTIRGTDDQVAGDTTGNENKGFWASLGDLFVPDEDRYTYSEGIRRGGYLLTASVPEGMESRAEEVLESADPIDLDERTQTWRQEGWTGARSATATGMSGVGTTGYADTLGAGSGTASAATTGYGDRLASDTSATGTFADRTARDDETLQVVDEELRVGKRQTGGGNVRVRTYVSERPVEAQVDLRTERVTIDRRPVDREVTPGVGAFQERTIEAVERGEEAVVEKVARVKEEIGLHKDVETRTETVRDTVRETEVEVDDDRGTAINDRRP